MKTYIHFRGTGTVQIEHEWGGCNLIHYQDQLWRVADAVFGMDRVDVYAYRLSDGLESESRIKFGAWTARSE